MCSSNGNGSNQSDELHLPVALTRLKITYRFLVVYNWLINLRILHGLYQVMYFLHIFPMIPTCVCEFNVCYIHVWLFMVIENNNLFESDLNWITLAWSLVYHMSCLRRFTCFPKFFNVLLS